MTGNGKSGAAFAGSSVLVLVENLSVPFDRRVWQECTSLRHAGFDVTVICPRGTDRDDDAFEERDGIKIHRFLLQPAEGGGLSYIREYAVALWKIQRLMRSLSRRTRFDVVHACNPPDLLLLPAVRLRRRQGTRLVFDHHDLAPELYLSRFGRERDSLYRALRVFERLSFRIADVVIATNESYREIAMRRGAIRPEDVFVVRNGPDLDRFRPTEPDPAWKRGKRYLLAYVGMMGPQDGIDYALRALAALRQQRSDWHALFVGDGDVVPQMQQLADQLGLHGLVEFTGLLQSEEVVRVLSSADVCLAPEPLNALNDLSTMIKVAEYLAMGRPVVAFDLKETRRTAGSAALYAPVNDVDMYAKEISSLLDDEGLRATMGATGRRRVEDDLSWEHSERRLLAAYERVLSPDRPPTVTHAPDVAVG
ncbi:MAG TPA: glycosyltransferase WbuB [Chloroflexi bacterium]|jgi:glycosyltransferase involved in cell wall biosynthesis|nr:glycosyltransferase WbuB [Chloroflexota bacterium]